MRVHIFSLLLVLVLTISACKNSGPSTPALSSTPDRPEEPETVTISESDLSAQPVVLVTARALETLEPYYLTGMHPDESVAAHIWDTLVWIDDDLALSPMLAESWRLVNNLTWQFDLRQDVFFHNGEPFDAEAAKFSLERSASLENSLETFCDDASLEAVEVIDEYAIRVQTSEPVANLPYLISGVEMLPPVYYDQTPATQLAGAPVGSGPYRVQSWTPGQPLILEANPDYWQGEPLFPTLIFDSQATAAARLEALLNGAADLAADLTPEQAAAAETDETTFMSTEGGHRLFIGIRPDPETPLADVRVRQALNYAIDREALIDEFTGGFGRPYGSWVLPPGANSELPPWPYDPQRALSLLKESGYAEGFKVALDTSTGHYYNDVAVAQAVAEQLAQIDVQVTVNSHDWEAYVTTRLAPQRTSPLFLLAMASRGDPLTDVANLSYAFPFNPTQWLNADFEALLGEARATFNDQRRLRALHQAQAIAYEEAPWIWLWRLYDFYARARDLDWTPRADGLIYLYRPLLVNPDSMEESNE